MKVIITMLLALSTLSVATANHDTSSIIYCETGPEYGHMLSHGKIDHEMSEMANWETLYISAYHKGYNKRIKCNLSSINMY